MKHMLMLMAALLLVGCDKEAAPVNTRSPARREVAKLALPPVPAETPGQSVRSELERIQLQRLKNQVMIRAQDARARAAGREPHDRVVRNPIVEAMSNEDLAAAIEALENK